MTNNDGCGGLEAEALVAGRLVRLPKHSSIIELYGALEEAEALLAEARLRSRGVAAAMLVRLQEAVRMMPFVLAGALEPEEVERLLEGLDEELPEAAGWSLSGCSLADALVARALTRLRAGERLLSLAAEEGLVPRGLAERLGGLLARLSMLLYRARWLICGAKAEWRPRLSAAAGPGIAPKS